MSASNWAVCPGCLRNHEKAVKEAEERYELAYGKVSRQRYVEMALELSYLKANTVGQTFREDYQFYGAEEGEVHADYSGECSTCHLSVSFNHTEPIPL